MQTEASTSDSSREEFILGMIFIAALNFSLMAIFIAVGSGLILMLLGGSPIESVVGMYLMSLSEVIPSDASTFHSYAMQGIIMLTLTLEVYFTIRAAQYFSIKMWFLFFITLLFSLPILLFLEGAIVRDLFNYSPQL